MADYSIEDAQRALEITNALNDFIKKGREYEGDDEQSLAIRKLLNSWNTDSLRDNVVSYMLKTEDDDGNPMPRMSGVMTANQMNDYFLDQLKGWDEMYEKMNAMRLMANKQEDERQKAEAAVEAQKEIAQKTVEDVKKLSEAQTEQIQQLNDKLHDVSKLEKLFGLSSEADKSGNQADTSGMGVGGEAQQTMQQVAPDVAQATPQPAPVDTTPPAQDMNGQGTPDMNAGGPMPDMTPPSEPPAPPSPPPSPASPPSPDMGGGVGGGVGGGMMQGGMFEPSEGMLNAVQPRMGM